MEFLEIHDAFYLKGQIFKILSGAIHYFELTQQTGIIPCIIPKALGFNTVETYVPWNAHEPCKGQFDFSGRLDLERLSKQPNPLTLHDCKVVAFICRVGIWWITSLALRRRPANPLIRPSLVEAVDVNMIACLAC